MRTPVSRILVLVLALLAGQWLTVAHAHAHAEHDAHPALTFEQTCTYCLHASGADGGALPCTASTATWAGQTEAPHSFGSFAPPGTHARLQQIRGPPHTDV
jgi:disulfide bond formation protein DsbB